MDEGPRSWFREQGERISRNGVTTRRVRFCWRRGGRVGGGRGGQNKRTCPVCFCLGGGRGGQNKRTCPVCFCLSRLFLPPFVFADLVSTDYIRALHVRQPTAERTCRRILVMQPVGRGPTLRDHEGEPDRRPTYHRLLRRGLATGVAADDWAAIHYICVKIHACIGSRSNVRCYRVGVRGGVVREEVMKTRYRGV